MARGSVRAKVGVRELRQNLSVYLDRVKKGEVLTVTEHGAPVAVLRPLTEGGSVLEQLVAEGQARRPSREFRSLPRPLRLPLDPPLSRSIEEDRNDRP